MAKKSKKKEDVKILESPEALVETVSGFFDNKRNQTMVFSLVGIITAVIIGFAGYNYYLTSQNEAAQQELFQAQFYFESDSLDLALNGDGNSFGFLEIIEDFSGTKVANLSHFYAGVSYLKLGDFEGATRYLKEFSSDDYLLQARAYSLIGDAYLEQDDFENAIEYYKQACDYKPNESFTPIYLKKLAIAQEQNGYLGKAAASYDIIEKKYPKSTQIHDAKKQKARLEAMTQ